jgi:DNA-binding CsgD family transcriptional regulator
MKKFHEMLRKITSSPYHDKMMQFASPLKDHFSINHFWYYRICNSGHYSYIGTHSAWNEYCFENHMIEQFPCLRHPATLQNGISLMARTRNDDYQKVLDTAREKYNINFNINLIKKIPEGMEAFGFATQHDHVISDEKLLNELPLLRHFIKVFRERYKNLFELLYDSQVDLSAYLGPLFTQVQKQLHIPSEREIFLKKLGCHPEFTFTAREKEVLRYISKGYSAPYIATQLSLSRRTIENYIATIKCKLFCNSKTEMIQKAQELFSIGYLEFEIT